MKKFYKHDSNFNVLRRILRSLSIRLRGRLFLFSRSFSGNPALLFIGKNLTLRNGKLITLNGKLKIGDNCRIELFPDHCVDSTPSISFGNHVALGNNVHIGCFDSIIIGDNVLMGSNILIIDHNHGNTSSDLNPLDNIPPRKRSLNGRGPIIIGNNVWICDMVVITSGVNIGDGAIISAGKKVTENVPPYTVF